MIDLEKIKIQILEGTSIEKILSRFDWSGFEEAVAEIFLVNGFNIKRNFRFKTKQRYEIDIIAYRAGKIICVDCKGWRGGRNKKSNILKAAEKQKERVKQLKNFVSKNPIVQSSLKISETHQTYIPMIVTLLEEDLKKNDSISDGSGVLVSGIVIVPVWKLNSFLNSTIFLMSF